MIFLILVNLAFTIINIVAAWSNYEHENYKTAIFNGFAAGVSAMAVCAMVIMDK